MAKRNRPVEEVVTDLYRKNYRLASGSWVGGENRIEVKLDPTPAADAVSREVWHRKHAWKGTNLDVRLTVSPTWRRSVVDRGLAVLDGLLTTHARKLRQDGDVTAYAASWVRQGRGLSIRSESGVIAFDRQSGTAFHHADGDAAGAINGLRRKLRNQAIPQGEKDEGRRRRQEAQRARLERLGGKLARHDLADVGHVIVTREDSLRAGNCVPGTDQFIDTLFPDRISATIAEIAAAVGQTDLTGLDQAELTLARQIAAACLVAIRRHRQERRGQRPPGARRS